jgi:transcriptional regulator with XRE-family HTH domain
LSIGGFIFMQDSFGARLKFFRSKAGLSQQQLADSAGLSRKIISDYEVKQDVLPRTQNLFKISQALGIESLNLMPKDKIYNDETLHKQFTNPTQYFDLSLISKEALTALEAISREQSIPVERVIENLITEKYPEHIAFIKSEGLCEPDDATLQALEMEKMFFNYLKSFKN